MHARKIIVPALLALSTAACGHGEDEWQAQLAKYRELADSSAATQKRMQSELDAERDRVKMLMGKLEAAGVDISKLKTDLETTGSELNKMSLTLEEQAKALAEYRAKARQLEAIKARFDLLRKKLDELTKLGLAVTIRNNRMVISLPGDVLFDSGRETLKKEGKEILAKVAGVIKADPALVGRYYQVAGHTDADKYAGAFRDNWGLSLMRAREVLLFLVDPGTGGMPSSKWSAAGFGDTDPVATNSSSDGKQKNRRCDVIVVPSVEEMLDLKTIAN